MVNGGHLDSLHFRVKDYAYFEGTVAASVDQCKVGVAGSVDFCIAHYVSENKGF
jgi:hypothetical protein